jgi:hypothetical protein
VELRKLTKRRQDNYCKVIQHRLNWTLSKTYSKLYVLSPKPRDPIMVQCVNHLVSDNVCGKLMLKHAILYLLLNSRVLKDDNKNLIPLAWQ